MRFVKTGLAQIARAATLFHVAEIIVYDETSRMTDELVLIDSDRALQLIIAHFVLLKNVFIQIEVKCTGS